MKSKLVPLLCAVALIASSIQTARADADAASAVADVVIVRPLCFAATIIGSAVFIVALPIAATSGSVKETADLLVGKPARATFKRPIGDFDNMED